MTDQTKKLLREARSLLGKCAGKISSKKTKTKPLSDSHREMLIGFGTARDYIRWAVSLRELRFQGAEERSPRKAGITEMVRFNQIWTAANAIFAKESILGLIPAFQSMTTSQRKEIARIEIKQFEQIYQFASLNIKLANDCLTNLNDLLATRCAAEGINGIFGSVLSGKKRAYPTPGTPPFPTMWEVIDHRYLRPSDRKRGLGRVITMGLRSKTMPIGDGPGLIYATRNWAVHGVLLTSFFRGSPQKFMAYIDNVTLLLSAVMRGSAVEFLRIL